PWQPGLSASLDVNAKLAKIRYDPFAADRSINDSSSEAVIRHVSLVPVGSQTCDQLVIIRAFPWFLPSVRFAPGLWARLAHGLGPPSSVALLRWRGGLGRSTYK